VGYHGWMGLLSGMHLDLTPRGLGSQLGLFAHRLLDSWERLDFEPHGCAAVLDDLATAFGLSDGFFTVDEIFRGGYVATDRLLFDSWKPGDEWSSVIVSRGGHTAAGVLGSEDVVDFARIVREAERAANGDAFRAALSDEADDALLELFAGSPLVHGAHGEWPPANRPGIFRREHASIVIRSSTTTLLTDPQSLNAGWTTNGLRYPSDVALEPDGILITHTHGDHWHLPSVVRCAGEGTTIVVPPVTTNLLAHEDPRTGCELAGLRTIAPRWWSVVRIGDIDIQVLPFFGEQPTRSAPGPREGLRNWGSCYRFDTPHFSAIILVDSGIDPAGSALEVVERSVAELGPVDALLSCAGEFPEAINRGLAHYILALPFERLVGIHRKRRVASASSMTLGPNGVAEACRIARARYFLPYAHGFSGIATSPRGESGPGEAGLFSDVTGALARSRAATRAVEWKPGDVALFCGRELVIERATPPTSP
jgi:L-ascorbate metabolism protein UlaG (beta-lactamase superfamily)